MGEVIARFIAIICMGWIVTNSEAKAEDALDPLLHPGTRFLRENIESEKIAHWVGPVGVQFLGIRSIEIQQKVLSEVMYLGSAANTDLKVYGFPKEIFEGNSIDSGTRMLFIEFEGKLDKLSSNGMLNENALGGIGLVEASPPIRSVLDLGLIKQSDGCFARWTTNNENAIEAIIVAASNSLSQDKRLQCLWGLVPSAFGISTLMSKYDAGKATGKAISGGVVVFYDRSEFVLALSAAAICRDELDDLSYKCPFQVIKEVFANHAYMAPWTVN